MSEKIENNQRPFAEELLPGPYGRSTKLLELKEHPHVVVRRDLVDISTKEKLADEIAKLNQNKALFSSLEEDGMRVAKFDYAIGNKGSNGRAESYALIEKIDGKNLLRMETFDARAAEEVDQCYAGYLTHVLHILQTGGRYWSDMHSEQIVYGTREGDDMPHAYVVDVDPYVSSWMNEEGRINDPPKAVSDAQRLVMELRVLSDGIRLVEWRTENKARLQKTRAKFHEVLAILSPAVAELGPGPRRAVSLLQEELKRM